MGNLSKEKDKRDAEREDKEFPFANLMMKKPDAWENLQDFYGIADDFPYEYLYFQQTEQQKRIVLLNAGLHLLMMDCKKKFKLDTVNLGLMMFEKNRVGKEEVAKSRATYRLLQEGLQILLPYMDESRQIHVKPEFIQQIVEEPDRAFTYTQIAEKFDEKLMKKFKTSEDGSAVIRFATQEQLKRGQEPHAATVWIGRNNVSLMIDKQEAKAFMFLIQ